MPSLLLVAILLITVKVKTAEPRSMDYHTKKAPKKDCVELPEPILSDILGPAYNSRYMSIDKPPVMEDEPISGEGGNAKRGLSKPLYPSFYVNENHLAEIGTDPAWEVKHAKDTTNLLLETTQTSRSKRDTMFHKFLQDRSYDRQSRLTHLGRGMIQEPKLGSKPWECEGKIRWLDLGAEYFPRYLRTVECAKSRCYYGQYQCLPRSFTVKILRRRTGECVPRGHLKNVGVDGLPGELRELWIWEERAVNFCCDCAS
ncbi:protein trunk [Sabethes cyaneus]|uniref:protein trunk n=1 Tax=Sabethes cyaneus TaxID=53552 RepID=UPI00237D4FAD|nr:protein trunk [Sabethes cyaneus]